MIWRGWFAGCGSIPTVIYWDRESNAIQEATLYLYEDPCGYTLRTKSSVVRLCHRCAAKRGLIW